MKAQFNALRVTRSNVLKAIESLTDEQLNTKPAGFRNTIAWNLGHLLATQQLLTYGLSGNPFVVDQFVIDTYRKGTEPTEDADEFKLTYVKSWLASSADQLEKDYEAGLFKEFKTYPTSYGLELGSIEEAIEFNNMHEAMHLGYILAMKKSV